MDKVHSGSYTRFLRLYNGCSTSLCRHCPASQLLIGVQEHCAATMGRSGVLFRPVLIPHRMPPTGLCVEIVRPFTFCDILVAVLMCCSSYRRTYYPASYHIVQEIQKFNLSDYRPRQEQ